MGGLCDSGRKLNHVALAFSRRLTGTCSFSGAKYRTSRDRMFVFERFVTVCYQKEKSAKSGRRRGATAQLSPTGISRQVSPKHLEIEQRKGASGFFPPVDIQHWYQCVPCLHLYLTFMSSEPGTMSYPLSRYGPHAKQDRAPDRF